MYIMKGKFFALTVAIIALFSFTSCLTAKKLDRFVAEHYNHEVPKQKKKTEIIVTTRSFFSGSMYILAQLKA